MPFQKYQGSAIVVRYLYQHTFTSIPMQKSFSAEHSSKLFRNSLEDFLNGSRISNKGGGHFEAARRDVANSCLDIVRDPFNKVRAVFVLNVQHLFVHFLHGHTASENGCNSQVAAMAGVTGSHHVLGIEHLLSERRDTQCSRKKNQNSKFNHVLIY